MKPAIALMPPSPQPTAAATTPPARRRRLMTPDEIVTEKFNGRRSERWVREHAPKSAKVPHGSRPPLYYEDVVDLWVYGVSQAS